MPTHLLFICSRNQWRSPTAEEIYKNHPDRIVRSAGTENGARIRVTEKMILWADLLFVMEKKHKQRLFEKFPETLLHKQVIVLEIPDEYPFMDPELVEMIKLSVEEHLPKMDGQFLHTQFRSILTDFDSMTLIDSND